ncbi:hypothetical protein ACVWXO_001843 [Bradyrhizobium sp. LM2.7]
MKLQAPTGEDPEDKAATDTIQPEDHADTFLSHGWIPLTGFYRSSDQRKAPSFRWGRRFIWQLVFFIPLNIAAALSSHLAF